MAEQNSVQVARAVSTPRTMSATHEDRGRIRIKAFDFKQSGTGAVGSFANLVRMDVGNIRILQIVVTNTSFGSGRTISYGHGVYDTVEGTQVVASNDLFVASSAVNASGTKVLYVNKVVNSISNYTIHARFRTGTVPANAKLTGYVLYVND